MDTLFYLSDRGDWGDWSDWSLCSVSCGFGIQDRKRDCLTVKCQGESFESRPCFMSYCPVRKLMLFFPEAIRLQVKPCSSMVL